MAWGAMGGIGAALTNLSANMAEMDKAKLRDKLEADREVAREAREAAKLKRTTSYRKLTNGKWQSYNADDELLRETAATPEEISKAKQDAEIAELDIRSKRATAATTETELEWAKQDRNLLTPEQRALAAKIKAGLELSAAEKEQARRWGLEYAQRDRHHSENVSARKAGLEGRLSDTDDGMAQSVEAAVEQARNAGLPEAIIQRLRSQATSEPTIKKLPKGGTINIKPTPEQANIAFIELLNKELQKSYGAGNKGLIRGKPGALETE